MKFYSDYRIEIGLTPSLMNSETNTKWYHWRILGLFGGEWTEFCYCWSSTPEEAFKNAYDVYKVQAEIK